MITEGDVKLYQSADDGEIDITDGLTELTGGFDTSFYLSIFGGNVDDDGSQDNPATWWGNLLENAPEGKYVSRTQNLLQGLPASSGNLGRIEESVRADLAWYLDIGIATAVEVAVSIPDYGKIRIAGAVTVQGEKIPFEYTENWKAAQAEALGVPGGEGAPEIPSGPGGEPNTEFPAPTATTESLATDGVNLISCNGLDNKVYIHNGVSNEIITSINAPGAFTTGVAFDPATGNIITADAGTKLISIHDGKTDIILSSFAAPSGLIPRDITVANGDLISCNSTQSKIYIHDGISATVVSSFSSAGALPDGLSFDGVNLKSSSLTNKRVYLHNGVAAATLDNFSSPEARFSTGTETTPTGDTITCNLDTIYIHSGFSAYTGP